MPIGKSTIVILSILLISKCITYAWSNTHDISFHRLAKRDQEFKVETKLEIVNLILKLNLQV